MSGAAPPPSLLALPPELLDIIIYGPSAPSNRAPWRTTRIYGPRHPVANWTPGTVASVRPFSPYILPDLFPHRLNLIDDLATLAVLARTCKGLRAHALPGLWATVHVETVAQLGKLRNIFRSSPKIPRLITSFTFAWHMDDDLNSCNVFPEAEGTLLDLAFRNRREKWDEFVERHECQVKIDRMRSPCKQFVEHNDELYLSPGKYKRLPYPPLWLPYRQPLEDPLNCTKFDYEAPIQGGTSPDGKGEDRLIKNAEQFNECLTDVVSQLSSLHTFCWCCPVTPLPVGAYYALARLTSLRALHLDFSSNRSNMHDLPFWNLTSNLRRLSISTDRDFNVVPFSEESEPVLTSVELPTEEPLSSEARAQLNKSIAERTVIAAARGGHLRVLNTDLDRPFKVRALLPIWLGVELDNHFVTNMRACLQHASQRNSFLASFKNNGTLTVDDVRSLRGQLGPEHWQVQRVDSYLRWLEEDVDLAQQVVDAWNAVVNSGCADK